MAGGAQWTYTQNPGNSTRDAVRLLVGDTDSADKQLTDGEIAWALSEESNVYFAAAILATTLAARYANSVSKQVGDLRIQYGERQKHYADLAKELKSRGVTRSGKVFAGGISEANKEITTDNSDNVSPSFKRGLHDNPNTSSDTIDFDRELD